MSYRMEYNSGSPHRTESNYSQEYLKRSGFLTALPSVPLYKRNAVKNEYGLENPKRPECLDLANPFSGVLQKMNEKEQLHGLNDRFAGFIEKVRHLEHQNQLLEREIEDINQKAHSPSSVAQEYEAELGDLRKLVQDITLQKRQVEMEHRSLEEDFLILREKCNKEARTRSDAENSITLFKKDVNNAYLAKLQLEKKAQSLVDEIHLLKTQHEVEVSETLAQIQEAHVKVKAYDLEKSDLTAALRDIRAQLEGHAVSDINQVDECLRAQFEKMNEVAESNRKALKATTLEIQENRRRLLGKNIELDCAKGTKQGLEKQLRELEERHHKEMINYQDAIKQLENEIISAKFDMSGHLREYQDLLNVKMALDVEILSYRKLLEGEETHLSTMSGTHISMPYIYRQSPVYTLPCLSRQGGPTRRAEPQYKFVEEIITETTREVEMSEFEESRSEDTAGGEAEERGEGGVKSQNGGSEGEEEDGSREEGTPQPKLEQLTEGQKVQKSSQDMDPDSESPTIAEDKEEDDKDQKKNKKEIDTTEKRDDTEPHVKMPIEVTLAKALCNGEIEKVNTDERIEIEKNGADVMHPREDSKKMNGTKPHQVELPWREDSFKDTKMPQEDKNPNDNSTELDSSLTKEAAESVSTEDKQDFPTKPPEHEKKMTKIPEKDVSPNEKLVKMVEIKSVDDKNMSESESSPKPDENEKTSREGQGITSLMKSQDPETQAVAIVENQDSQEMTPESTKTPEESELVKALEKASEPQDVHLDTKIEIKSENVDISTSKTTTVKQVSTKEKTADGTIIKDKHSNKNSPTEGDEMNKEKGLEKIKNQAETVKEENVDP